LVTGRVDWAQLRTLLAGGTKSPEKKPTVYWGREKVDSL